MSSEFVGVRIPAELHADLLQICAIEGITMSEYVRASLVQSIHGRIAVVDDGYRQARALAVQLTHEIIRQGTANLPQTWEEYVERYGPNGPEGI